ncbi:hypothetical protein C8R44DRAFT_874685 [Mycena epipterygia]|nr:hypothetical protein C8R44DRAFT_874685 [Mycena epipterygia]
MHHIVRIHFTRGYIRPFSPLAHAHGLPNFRVAIAHRAGVRPLACTTLCTLYVLGVFASTGVAHTSAHKRCALAALCSCMPESFPVSPLAIPVSLPLSQVDDPRLALPEAKTNDVTRRLVCLAHLQRPACISAPLVTDNFVDARAAAHEQSRITYIFLRPFIAEHVHTLSLFLLRRIVAILRVGAAISICGVAFRNRGLIGFGRAAAVHHSQSDPRLPDIPAPLCPATATATAHLAL